MGNDYYRGKIASRSFDIVQDYLFLGLHILILVVCIKFSHKMEDERA